MSSKHEPQAPVTLYRGRWLTLRQRGTWEYAERNTPGGGAVIVIAVTPEDKVLFVEQYRVPIDQKTTKRVNRSGIGRCRNASAAAISDGMKMSGS